MYSFKLVVSLKNCVNLLYSTICQLPTSQKRESGQRPMAFVYVLKAQQARTFSYDDDAKVEQNSLFNTMPPKKNRLTRKTFLDILPKTKTKATPFFTVRYLPSKIPHFSVIISKKIAPHATDRNYLRRRIYHFLKKQVQTGTYMVFVKKPFENKAILENSLIELGAILS